jgi:pyruvate/2-oxoglutarate/acetoin dehydrogenase E1 component
MAELTYRDAVARGIAQEMARDPDVVFLGEDVAAAGGVFKATVGLLEQFGPVRVRDTPISTGQACSSIRRAFAAQTFLAMLTNPDCGR